MADALIDTSALIAHFRRRLHPGNTLSNYRHLYVSTITVYELEYGARRIGRLSDWEVFLELFPLHVLSLGLEEARRAAAFQAALAAQNRHIGERDVLIAATALVHGLDLVTLNANEFQRVPELRVVVPT
ncbi:type II toxin-antitoxin system VapC family toxin [Rhodothermus marinus]|uniref:type II toxin-antitoxin system VapC family toxin n=1 Tax=Rhodothermus marinus TaxID=29549 RepID=UPI0037C54F07